MRVEFEGNTFELPDGTPDEQLPELLEAAAPTKLFSVKGIASTLRLVGPSLARGVLGAELAGMEEVQLARDAKVKQGIPLTLEEQEDLHQMQIRRQAIKEADLEISKLRGQPTKPLEIAQAVTQSVAANLPGVGAAAVMRQAGPVAAAPALLQAEQQAFGQTYAESRVGKEAEIEPSLKHARVAGVAEAGFELLPTTWLIKNLGKTGAVEFATKYIARELATELPTTATTKIAERMFVEPNKPLGKFMEELTQELIDTALVTPFAAGATGLAAHGLAKTGELGKPGVIEDKPRPEQPPPPPPRVEAPPVPFDQPSTDLNLEQQVRIQAIVDKLNTATITDDEVTAAREHTRKLDEARKNLTPEKVAVAWGELVEAPVEKVDASELGASERQAANAPNYINPNIGDRLQRKFSFGPENAIGKTPNQVLPEKSTYVLGEATEDRPDFYLNALRDTVEGWRQKFLPDATIVLSNEQLFTDSALGWHYTTRPGFHMIVPAVLRSPSKGLGAFNVNTQASAFYNATHEFGHALVKDRLLAGVDPLAAKLIWQESEQGLVSDQALEAVRDEKVKALIQYFNELKTRVLSNEMTAQEYLDLWAGPAKAARKTFLQDLDVSPTDNAMAVAKAMARRARLKSNVRKEVKQGELEKQLLSEFFGLEEFLAEQLSRHAYAKKWEAKTPLGKLFGDVFIGLRQALADFFKHLKATGGIRAGTAFQEWLDDLSRADRPLTKSEKVAKGKAKGPAKVVAEKPVEKKPAPKAKVQRVQHNTETETRQVKVDMARKLLVNLARDGSLTPQDADFKEMNRLIKLEDWDEFMDIFQRYSSKKVKFELDKVPDEQAQNVLEKMQAGLGNLTEEQALDPSILAEAAKEWKEKGFRSRFFKAYFGDWEADQAAYHESGGLSRDPLVSAVRTASGEPLPVYHLTRAWRAFGRTGRISFTEFAAGDIGFHFGTPKAAMIRGTHAALSPQSSQEEVLASYEQQAAELASANLKASVEDAYIIPATLNLKNPLDIGPEELEMWHDEQGMLGALFVRKIITAEESKHLYNQLVVNREKMRMEMSVADLSTPQAKYIRFEPIRQVLARKGYDGLVYDNLAEGDRSWVAFYPEQVKSLLGHGTFSRSKHMHLELDFDKSTPEGEGASKMYSGLKNFHPDPAGWRRALRKAQQGSFQTLQIQQLAHLNPDVEGLVDFNTFNTYYNLRKNKLQAPADHITQRWQSLGKENLAKVNRFLIEEMEGGTNWFEPVSPTLDPSGRALRWEKWQMSAKAVEEMKKRGIDFETDQGKELATLILDVKNDLLFRLNEMEKVINFLVASRYAGGSDADIEAAVKPVVRHIQNLRHWPFFPQGRFGRYMLTIERKRTDAPGYEVVWREAFESREKRDEAWRTADSKKAANERVHPHELGDQTYVMLGLPTDFVDLAASELDLSEEQVDLLLNILQPVKKEKALKTYDYARLGIKGYTSDALRSYANFTWHDSNLIAKLEYRNKFNLALRKVKSGLRQIQFASPPNPYEEWRLEQIHRAMERAKDYIMAPPNELQGLRATLSVAYLGLNIKTALMNFYGLVTVWADITTEMGLVNGTAEMAKRTGQMFRTLQLTNLNERRPGDYLDPEHQQALDRALEEGVLSQSYAYHLAGLANQGNLNRLIPGYNLSSRISKRAIDVAMWPFRLTELSSRRVAFLTQYELAKRKGLLDPYAEAVRKTNLLQNDYSLGNRVPFMRGGFASLGPIAPLATVFMSFAQHMAFHSYGGYELGERRSARLAGMTPRSAWAGYTMKIWLLTLLVAGYEGLPGAENILDILETFWRKFGGQKPIRQTLREYVQATDIGLDPQAAAHGFGHNILGFDISRSIGFGRFVPGTDVFNRSGQSIDETAGTLVLDMLGVAGSFIKSGAHIITDPKPMSEKLTRLPGGLGNIWTAHHWSENGVRAPTGALITHDLETGKLRDLTDLEIWGKALGFNPTIVSQNREIRFQQYDRKIYWQTRRDILLDDVWRARWQGDREAEADARKAVSDFNASISSDYSDLRVRPIDIFRSIQTRNRIKRLEESQLPPQRRFRQLYRDVRESYGRREPGP